MNAKFKEYLENVSKINHIKSNIFIYKGDIKDYKIDCKQGIISREQLNDKVSERLDRISKNKSELKELEAKNKVIKKDPEFKENAADRKTDRSFFRKNELGYNLFLLGILFEAVYIILICNRQLSDSRMFLVIIANIGFLLFAFTASLAAKVYKKSAVYGQFTLIIYLILRISVFIPFIVEFEEGVSKANITVLSVIILMLISASTVVTVFKIREQDKYKKDGKISFAEMSK